MAFSGNFLCSSFKQEVLEAKHNFLASGGNTFKIALYDNSASFNAATTAFTSSNEIAGGSTGITSGGISLTSVNPTLDSTTAVCDFNDAVFSSVTVTGVRGALIYNSSSSNRAVAVLDFGGDKAASAGDFTVVFPTANASNAIIRIA
tara:strand:- start:506 stop:946 length:441 start_codon:yes stop_codon:yes gene_type:complete